MTTAAQVIRAAIPDADKDVIDYVLWNRTPFPFDARPRTIYRCAAGYNRASRNSIALCDFCRNRAESGAWACAPCRDALDPSTRQGEPTP